LKFQTENSRIGILDLNLASPGEVFSLSLPLRWHRAFRRAELFYQDWLPLADFFPFFFVLGGDFFSPKTLKKQFLPECPKISKIFFFFFEICGPILVAFWIHFGVLLPEKIHAKTGNGKDQENHQKSCFSEE
jgi:hypothetical protein